MRSSKRNTPKRTVWQHPSTWLALVLLVIAISGGIWWLMGMPGNPLKPTATANSGPDFNTTVVRRGDLQISASGSGTLTASQSVDLSFPTRGMVTRLNVKAGDVVKTGDVLAQLGNTDALKATLAAAQLKLLQDQKTLNDLQTNASTALAQAYQALITAQDNYNTALTTDQRTAYARCSKPVVEKYAAQVTSYQDKLNNLNPSDLGSDTAIAIQGALDTATANFDYCSSFTTQEKTDASASLQVAQVAVTQAAQTYNTLKTASGIDPTSLAMAEAKVQADQTTLTQAQNDLQGITLIAPMNGTVTFLAANQGAIVDTSKYLTISDTSSPVLQISVDEADLNKLVVGSKVTIVFDALPDQTLNGSITSVDPQLSTSGNVKVATGQVALDDAALKAIQGKPLGLNATVTVIEKEARNALLVPISALRNLGENDYAVFVVRAGKLNLTPVKVGLQDSTHAEILSGLNDGDVVSTGLRQTTGK